MVYTIPWDPITNKLSTTVVTRDSDSAWIPTDSFNTDYQIYLEWLRIGGIPNLASAPEVPNPKKSVTSFQQLMDLFTQDELTAMAISSDPKVRINIWQALSVLPGGILATDSRFISWVSYLESVGVLTQLRAMLVGSLIPPQ